MHTFFAPAERSDPEDLNTQIKIISNNPLVDGLLHIVGGLLAVLNENRQVVSINDSFLKFLGLDDPSEALGLRPGEALGCIHAQDEIHGCGTSRHCASCGAAISIVTSLSLEKPTERTCALTREQSGGNRDLALRVMSHPVRIQNQLFVLLFVQDITLEEQHASLVRTFFHDMNNTLTGLAGACQVLEMDGNDPQLIQLILRFSERLAKEVEIQRCLFLGESFDFQVSLVDIEMEEVLFELEGLFARHPATKNRVLKFPVEYPRIRIKTDLSLCLRVLSNMITNALEASADVGLVEIWIEEGDGSIIFCVWNAQVISGDHVMRVFQRNFSTKEGRGRGIGTYSMKLFGEKYLDGKVSFTSENPEGTVFRLELPV